MKLQSTKFDTKKDKMSDVISKVSGMITFWEGKGEITLRHWTRTTKQNSAMHKLFAQIAQAMNEEGQTFRHDGIIKEGIESPWNEYLIKEYVWRPVQIALTGKESTTELTTDEVDKVFVPINEAFAQKGIVVRFPSSYEKYLETQK